MRIVPQTRLILWAAIVLVPFGAAVGVNATALAVAGVVIALFATAAAADAFAARGSLTGIAVEFPEVVRLQREQPGEIDVRIRNDRPRSRAIRLGLAFPPEIVPERDDFQAVLPEGTPLSRIRWACTPRKRGRYFLEGCYIEATSPLGLWAVRGKLPARAELRVYPNLFDDRKQAAALFLTRGQYGVHAQRAAGQGREFEKLRDYNPGDSLQDVHWKASAKRGRLMTKVYQIERTQEVYVIVDSSRLIARGDAMERYITAALVLAVAAEQQGDLFGLVGFNDRICQFVHAARGKSHFDACRDALYTQEAKMVSPDFDELASFLRTRLRKRALLVFLTSLDDPLLAETFSRNIDLLCRQHLIVVNMLKPPGAEPLFTGAPVENPREIYTRLGGHLQWHHLNELSARLERHGIRFSLLDHEKLCAQVVSQYLEVKARQLL